MGHFINGLKDEIRKEIQVVQPYNLKQAIDLAIRVEDRDRAEKKTGSRDWANKFGSNKSNLGGSLTIIGPNNQQPELAISG